VRARKRASARGRLVCTKAAGPAEPTVASCELSPKPGGGIKSEAPARGEKKNKKKS